MHDRDLLAFEILGNVIGGDRSLLVVAPAGAEDVPHVAFGDLGIGGRGRDHEHAVLLVDLGGRNGDAGIEVADDEFDAVADELVGDRHAFLRIGAIVTDVNLNFLSENAAGGVDVLDRLLHSVLELRAEGGAAAGDRSGDAQLDLRRSVIRKSKAKTEGEAECEPLSHSVHLWMRTQVGRVSSRAPRDAIQPANRGNVTRILAYPRPAYRRGAASEIAPRVHGSICSG